MSSTSSCCSSQGSSQVSSQISTAVARKVLDAQAEQGREVVKMISSAQAIQDANAERSATAGSVDVYA